MSPFFSIIVPTRNRTATLQFTLNTIHFQDFSDYEVVISDNGTFDRVPSSPQFIKDSRFRLFDHSEYISMTSNFEVGISKATGKYIIVIGDDDGLVPGSLKLIHGNIISSTPSIIFWPVHTYFWPIESCPPRFHAGKTSRNRIINIRRLARLSSFFGDSFNHKLPSCYHCAVAKTLYESIRSKQGFLLETQAPDVYSTYLLPAFETTALKLGQPMTINGRSKASNSGVGYYKKGRHAWNDFIDQYGDYSYHRMVPANAPSALKHVLDVSCVARDMFPSIYNNKFYIEASWARLVRLIRSDNTLRENGPLFFRPRMFLSIKSLYYKNKSFSTPVFLLYYILYHLPYLARRLVSICSFFNVNRAAHIPIAINSPFHVTTRLSDCATVCELYENLEA